MPFLDPRSVSSSPPSVRVSKAWWRETPLNGRTMSFSGNFPIVADSAGRGNRRTSSLTRATRHCIGLPPDPFEAFVNERGMSANRDVVGGSHPGLGIRIAGDAQRLFVSPESWEELTLQRK